MAHDFGRLRSNIAFCTALPFTIVLNRVSFYMILFSQVFCPNVLLKCFAFVLIAHLLHHILCAFSRCGNPGLQAGVRTRVPRETVRVGYGVLIVVIILEMDSLVSSATPNSDALSYFPVGIGEQCMFDDESSSRAKTTVVQYHDDSANASACASSASDANIGRIDDGHVNDSANSDANRVMVSAVKDSVNSASDASQNIGMHSAVDNDLMGDPNKNASGDIVGDGEDADAATGSGPLLFPDVPAAVGENEPDIRLPDVIAYFPNVKDVKVLGCHAAMDEIAVSNSPSRNASL